LSGDIPSSPFLQKLIKNIPRIFQSARSSVSNGQPATRKMCFLLGLRIKRNCFFEVSLLAICFGKSGIQIKVMRIELLSPLALGDCLIQPVICQISGSGDVANNRRHRIQLLSLQHKLEPFSHVTAEERQQGEEK